ncbi:MAG: hypothetical protein KDC98_01050, partial [Planctomycetes bacterium]|nr:hypothetical protein [Planctomycetota bacterium]
AEICGDAATAATATDGQPLLVAAAVLGQAALTAPVDRQTALTALVDTELGSAEPRRRLLAAAACGALLDCHVATARKLLTVLAENDSIAAATASRTVTLNCGRFLPLLRGVIGQQPSLASPAFVRALPSDRHDAEFIDLLAGIAQTAEDRARRYAIQRLGNFGLQAAAHVAVVEAALKAPDSSVREAAVAALHRVTRNEDLLAEKLADALRDPDRRVVLAALRVSRSVPPFLPRTFSRMIELLAEPDCQDAVVDALGWGTKVSREMLQPALGSDDEGTRIAAVHVLVHQGLATDDDLAPVQQWLRSDEASTRTRALRLVRSLSGRRPELLPTIQRMLKGPERAAAIAAVATFGSSADDAASRLVAAMKDKAADVRREAACAIAVVAPGHRGAITALVQGAKDPDIAPWCNWSLRVMGTEAKAAFPGLRRLLQDRESPDRGGIADSLAAVGEVDKVVPMMLDLMKAGGDDDTARVAIMALADLFEREQAERTSTSKADKLSRLWRPVVKALFGEVESGNSDRQAAAYESLAVFAIDDAAAQRVREGLTAEGDVLAGVLRGLVRGQLPLGATEIERLDAVLAGGDGDLPELAGRALAQGGPEAQARLFAAMKDGSAATRRGAVLGLYNLPAMPQVRDEVFATLQTTDREMRQSLARHFWWSRLDPAVIERLVTRWDAAGDDIALRRTLAKIAVSVLVADRPEHDRLRAKLMTDDDPYVKMQSLMTAR